MCPRHLKLRIRKQNASQGNVACPNIYIPAVACSSTQIGDRAVNFWDTVTNTYRIDLTQFALPGQCTAVEFSCIDPIFVWIMCCNALHKRGIPLHWKPKTLRHPRNGEELYGAGIQYSKLLRAACKGVGSAGNVALFNINWDGGSTGFGSRSCTPIHAQVMNTNSSSTLAVGLVGYLPYINVPEGYRSRDNFKAARHHVLQVGTLHQPSTSYMHQPSTSYMHQPSTYRTYHPSTLIRLR